MPTISGIPYKIRRDTSQRNDATGEGNEDSEETIENLRDKAKSFHTESEELWPFTATQYYLGFIPKLDNLIPDNISENSLIRHCFIKRVHVVWHMHAIW